ncbi:MAG: tetratricopeptide repeat protein [Bacteriovorax sp.]
MSDFFDPADKKNKPVLDFFEDKSWLVIDMSARVRTSIKKSIAQLGSKMSNMHDADNFNDAQDFIRTNKPNFVIGTKTINGGSTIDLFSLHMKVLPNRLQNGFFILAEENSVDEVALALEYEMDGIISLPFTGFTIIDGLVNGVKHKISPSPYLLKVEEGRGSYLSGNLERATETFESSLTMDKHPYESYCFLGQIYSDYNLLEKAIHCYEDSIQHNSEYYKSLNRLSSLYYQTKEFKKAYELNFHMAQKFPTAPAKIPELIRLSIINKKYEDIGSYLKIFNTISEPDVQTQIYLAAGLAVLGKYFISHDDPEKGVEALKTAFKYSNGKYEILKSIMYSFAEAKKSDVLFKLFEHVDLALWPENVHGLYFYNVHLTSKDDAHVIALGEQLLKKKIKDIHIYRGVIERGIKMKRKIGIIEGQVLEAIKEFPESKEEFEELYARAEVL